MTESEDKIRKLVRKLHGVRIDAHRSSPVAYTWRDLKEAIAQHMEDQDAEIARLTAELKRLSLQIGGISGHE